MSKQERGVQTMERVLDAALACFTSQGVYDATIHALAERAEVSVGSIYHHFGSRERVGLALYCRCMESLLTAVAAAVSRHRKAEAGVRALVREYLAWVAGNPDAARFIYAAGQTEHVAKWKDDLAALKQRLVAPIVSWFAVHIASGAVIDLPPPLLEVILLGPPAEFARRWLAGAPGLELERALQVLPDTVCRSILREEGP